MQPKLVMSGSPTNTLPLRLRAARSGPEQSLIDTALRTNFIHDNRWPSVLFPEPALPTGFPDLVAVFLDRKNIERDRSEHELTQKHIRLLHHLYQTENRHINDLKSALLIPKQQIYILLQDLIQACLIELKGDRILLQPLERIFLARRIVAVEAKVSHWRKVILQAIANTWFASQSYVLLPTRRNLDEVLAEANKFGVGVFISEGETTRLALEAKENCIPASYGSWLLNEWAIRHTASGVNYDRPYSNSSGVP